MQRLAFRKLTLAAINTSYTHFPLTTPTPLSIPHILVLNQNATYVAQAALFYVPLWIVANLQLVTIHKGT